MKKKKDSNAFWWILGGLFMIFIALYIAMESGYYASSIQKKTTLTQEKILQFESDVKNGVEVDLQDYFEEEDIDYSNKATALGVKVSNGVEKFMTSGIKSMFDFVKKLVT